jgi:transcriptional regulator with XRE-family HTH domain
MEVEHVGTQELVMARLRLRELAEERGLNMNQVQRQSGLTMGAVRRYWYNTQDGRSDGSPLALVSLDALERLAALLHVLPGDLIVSDGVAPDRSR